MFSKMTKIGVACTMALASPLIAQTPAVQPVIEAPSADRIEAATELLTVLMPPAQREAMIAQMLEPMLDNIQQGMMQAPQFEGAFDNPEARELFSQFMNRQRVRTVQEMQASLPGMFEAMSRAYARRFTERQMDDIGEFFETDTGQAYMRESVTIMNDPDIASWQRQTMAQSMNGIQSDIAEFAAQVAALGNNDEPMEEEASSTNQLLDAMRGGAVEEETEIDE